MSTCKSFAPIVDEHSRILILGSMPGIKSLEQQEYYAHPQNRFWRLLALFQSLPDLQPAQIVDWLAQESGETLTPARLATLTQSRLAASFPSATAVMSPARWSRVMASLQGMLPAHLRIVRPAQRTPQLLAAFCSQDGLVINGHFGQGRLFLRHIRIGRARICE